MHCEFVKLPNGSSAIVTYSGSRKTQKCQFCSSRSEKLCDWPVERPVKIPHRELKADDTIVTVQHKYQLPVCGLQRFYVEVPVRFAPPRRVVITMYGLKFPNGQCCEAHSRSVGEDKDYCQEHWGAWESAG